MIDSKEVLGQPGAHVHQSAACKAELDPKDAVLSTPNWQQDHARLLRTLCALENCCSMDAVWQAYILVCSCLTSCASASSLNECLFHYIIDVHHVSVATSQHACSLRGIQCWEDISNIGPNMNGLGSCEAFPAAHSELSLRNCRACPS